MFLNKLVVWLVVVERLDNVVAVAPRVVAVTVVFKSAGIGVANRVEPVAAPALPVMRRRQQLFDHLGKCIRRTVVQEGLDVSGSGWQAGEIEIRAADQSAAVRGAGGLQLLCLQRGQNERVHRIGGAYLRERRPDRRHKRPIQAVFRSDGALFHFCIDERRFLLRLGVRLGLRFLLRIHLRTIVDPFADDFDIFRRETLSGRHGRLFDTRDEFVKPAVRGFARLNGKTAFATFQRRLQCAQIQISHLLVRAVAARAIVLEDQRGILGEIGS